MNYSGYENTWVCASEFIHIDAVAEQYAKIEAARKFGIKQMDGISS